MLKVKDVVMDDLFRRVRRQVIEGLDGERLLPSREKRKRSLFKRLEREMDRNGWRMFVSGCAHTMANGKAPQQRNAEASLIETVTRWRGLVLDLAPEQEGRLWEIVKAGLDRPEAPPAKK